MPVTQPRPSAASAYNPLNMHKPDTTTRKSRPSTSDNPISSKTVVSGKRNQDRLSEQTHKRQRPNETSRAIGNTVNGPRGIHSKRVGERKTTPIAIYSLSEDEDLGIPVNQSSDSQPSPDPLTLRSTTFNHAFDNNSTYPLGYVGDPPPVWKLRNKHRQPSAEITRSDSDDSQEFSDRPIDQSQSVEPRSDVQEETIRLNAKESASSSVPHIDLSLVQRGHIARSMKPKYRSAVRSKVRDLL